MPRRTTPQGQPTGLPHSFLRMVTGRRWTRIAAVAMGLCGAPVPAPAEHLVAVVPTWASPHQPAGQRVARDAEAAARAINAAGGVLGAPIRLQIVPENCTRARAEEVAGDLAKVRPAVVIGHLCAGAARAAADIYARAGLLFIAPGVRDPRLTAPPAGPLLFRLAGRDDRLASDTAAFVAARHLGTRVAVVGDRTLQARGLAEAIERELRQKGAPVVLSELIESGEKTYADLARRIRDSGAGVVIMPAQPIEFGVLAANLRQIGASPALIGTDVLAVPDIEPLARSEKERLTLMLPWRGLGRWGASHGGSPTLADLGTLSPDATAALAAAALEAWAEAVRLAGSTSPVAVAAALRQGAFATAVGPLSFDDNGDARVPAYVPYTRGNRGWAPVSASP